MYTCLQTLSFGPIDFSCIIILGSGNSFCVVQLSSLTTIQYFGRCGANPLHTSTAEVVRSLCVLSRAAADSGTLTAAFSSWGTAIIIMNIIFILCVSIHLCGQCPHENHTSPSHRTCKNYYEPAVLECSSSSSALNTMKRRNQLGDPKRMGQLCSPGGRIDACGDCF